MKWALEASKKTTLKGALDELEARIDGKKSRLVTVADFFALKPAAEISSDQELSAFFFEAMDMGKSAGISADLIMCKVLQHVPKAAKVFEDNKDTIVANMTEAVMFEIFELVRQKLSRNNVPSPNASVDIKHEVFYGSGVIPPWAEKLRTQVKGIEQVLHIRENSTTTSETPSSDDQAFFTAGNDKKARNKKDKCTICFRTNHVAEQCFKRVCQKCKGKGHDMKDCPSKAKYSKPTSNSYTKPQKKRSA